VRNKFSAVIGVKSVTLASLDEFGSSPISGQTTLGPDH
jgi:hypothetical protein